MNNATSWEQDAPTVPLTKIITINYCYQDLRSTTISSMGECHSPLRMVYDLVWTWLY
ncbi:MAG: hypothetical protein F6K40_21175 [Okeania sp. SIO3I5]|uniref:hypothetical protein n=1 Tax=Okeania sp. SIO3I5 TaxID=2607805 RepID=UPI0013B7C1C3|nr:hypothetical protein [Okeania sp. SIO3I5]NEQ38643.1 hypothetical protein [Okeania sp. SIO3I5]